MRLHYHRATLDAEPICTSISNAKKLLKQQGGTAWTEHIDRDGTVFETSEIRLNANNSRIKYNQHL